MLRMRLALSVVLLIMCSAFNVSTFGQQGDNAVQYSDDPEQLFEPREYFAQVADGSQQVLKYRLLKPLDYDPDKLYPLVVFLHGAGERGDDNVAQLKHCLREFCKLERRRDYPCYVLAPQCPEGEKWADVDWTQDEMDFPEQISNSLGLTMEVVDAMLADAAIDKHQVYIAGLSMGGYGTWDALSRRPELFAAAIPICGGGDPSQVSKYKQLPIWCFHGDADKSVAVEKSRRMIDALQQVGGKPKYTEYAGVGHDSWTRTFENEETFRWLFSQRRSSALPAE